MNLEEYRTLFAVGSLTLVLIAAAPTLGLIVPFYRETDGFSELWVLDSNHMADNYPFGIGINETHRVFVGISNQMSSSSYYLIYVKLLNETQPLPNAIQSEPNPSTPIYEFRAFVEKGGAWETSVTFGVLAYSRSDYFLLLSHITVNDDVLTVNASLGLNAEYNGFYFRLLFELWRYDNVAQSFEFHNRFVAIWLKLTT